MRIRAIRMRGAGPFASGVALEGLSGRLDVLAGSNELGKTTLFRGLEAVFQSKHTRGGEWLERLKSRGAAEMTIEADFEADGAAWRILKRFGRGATSELTRLDTGEQQARRQEADERLAALVGARTDAPGRLGLLWVGQGNGLRPVEPDGGKDRGERSALEAAIGREVETVAGGADARKVRARVVDLLDEQTTPNNRERAKKNSAYEMAIRRRDELAAALAGARQRAEETAQRRDGLARLRERLQALADPRARASRSEALAAAEAALRAADIAATELKAARATRDAKAGAHQAAADLLLAFDHKLQELADTSAMLASDGSRLDVLRKALATEAAALAKARDLVTRLEGEERDLAARIASLRAGEARSRLAAAQAIEARIRGAETELAANPVTPDRLRILEAGERAIGLIEARLAAAAPRVRIDYARGGRGRIRVAGAPLADGAEIEAGAPLVLEIEGVGAITVTPGADEGREEDRRDLAAHRDELEAGLKALGLGSMAAARDGAADRQRAEQSVREAKAERAGLAPQGVAALSREVERAFALAGGDADGAPPATPPAADGQLADATAASAGLRQQIEIARGEQARCERTHAAAEKEVERLASSIAAREDRLAAVERELPLPAVRAGERTRLAAEVAQRAREATDADRALAHASGAAPDDAAMGALRTALETARRASRAAEAEIAELERQAARIEGALEDADEKGAGTEVDRLAGELARAESEADRHRARVEALALLESVLEEAEAAARDRFLEPVAARLAPFVALAFPEARLRLGEGFSVAALERSGLAEALDALSHGTQEQIAVLVRCAFGRLLAEAGTPAPLILDDALVYSDDARIERMFAALELAAGAHQVLVLTCRERTFERLAGHRLTLVPWSGG